MFIGFADSGHHEGSKRWFGLAYLGLGVWPVFALVLGFEIEISGIVCLDVLFVRDGLG